MTSPTRIKLTIVGDGACGKTCLLMVFKDDKFPSDYIPTVFENDMKCLTVDEKEIELVLWDTAGQEDYDSIRPLSYPNTDVILLCYSISSVESFANISHKWLKEIKWFCPKVPLILVGLKKDLRSSKDTNSDEELKQKHISFEDGIKMAAAIGASAFMECSSLTREGVQEVFERAVQATLRRRKTRKHRLRKLICFTTTTS